MRLSRRRVVIALAAITGATTAALLWRWRGRPRGPYGHMRRDFGERRIFTVDGWFLSRYEVEALQLSDARPLRER